MKHYEDVARIIVNERIQEGLKAQAIHRALSENKNVQSKQSYSLLARKPVRRMIVVLVVLLLFFAGTAALPAERSDLAKLREATAQFHRTQAAQEAGYGLVPGLDYCFENPGVGAMGYHYINTGILDLVVDELQPEAMVYIPGPNGKLQLGAVEYIVPAAAWDLAGNSEPPSALGQTFHLNPALGVYVLHAWIWKNNRSGMFQDWNPAVSCP